MANLKAWFFQVLIGLDQFLNTIIGGQADETLSSWAYRTHKARKPLGFLMVWIDWLFFWQTNHCFSSFVSGEVRRLTSPADRADRDLF